MGNHIRQILPDQVYFIGNRCFEARFLLGPCDDVNAILGEELARAAQLNQVEIFAFLAMSSHFHALVRCPKQNLKDFLRDFQSGVAKRINGLRAREHSLFPERYHAAPVLDDATMVTILLYILMNPVVAGLVSTVREWPGFSTVPELLDDQKRVFRVFRRSAWHRAKRPRKTARFITNVPLVVSPLPCWRDLSPEECARVLRDLVEKREAELRAERSREGKPYLGRERVLQMHWNDRAESPERSPRPLCHAATAEDRDDYRKSYELFVESYRRASIDYRSGKRDLAGANFPRGSYPPWIGKAVG